MSRLRSLLDRVDERTGFRAGRRHLLDEPLPGGTGWWFVTGSIVMFLIGVQFVSGVVLTMFYVPAPDHAYDSVRFVMDRLPLGGILRGLHFFGASFIVIAAVVHMLRVVLFGSYKAPREATWVTGVLLLLIILGFALSGYLLPWDQKAYWATTVTINIARSGPFGDFIAGLLRGGPTLGALTLLRWYSAHVILLPVSLVGFVIAHVYLMRRHGISGPITPSSKPSHPFYPYHVAKDTLAMAAVFALLFALAATIPAPLDAVADPSDASYVPRPEWYFLSLFELLKFFPGRLEPVATIIIPGLVVGSLLLLPFLDRGAERLPLKRPVVLIWFAALGVGIVTLTARALSETPDRTTPEGWGAVAVAGAEFAKDPACARCHVAGGTASPIAQMRLTRDPEWLIAHVADPEVVAPGVRQAPAGGMTLSQGQAILAYMKKTRGGQTPPIPAADTRAALLVFGRHCVACHALDGDGGSAGPDLSHAGDLRAPEFLQRWITDPTSVYAEAHMPAFGSRLTSEEMSALVGYLARRE